MPRKRSVVLTDHELRLMEVLWTFEKSTVADVTARVGLPPLAYNTVLTTLRTLEQKGYVDHDMDGRAFVYRPVIVREEAAYSALRHVLHRFFGVHPETSRCPCLIAGGSPAPTSRTLKSYSLSNERENSEARSFLGR